MYEMSSLYIAMFGEAKRARTETIPLDQIPQDLDQNSNREARLENRTV